MVAAEKLVKYLEELQDIGYPYNTTMNMDKLYSEIEDMQNQALQMHHRLEVIRKYLCGLQQIVKETENA